jgi:hypothetical protein
MDAETVALLGADAVDEDGPHPVGIAAHIVIGLIAILVDQGELDSRCPRRPQPERCTTVADPGAEN